MMIYDEDGEGVEDAEDAEDGNLSDDSGYSVLFRAIYFFMTQREWALPGTVWHQVQYQLHVYHVSCIISYCRERRQTASQKPSQPKEPQQQRRLFCVQKRFVGGFKRGLEENLS